MEPIELFSARSFVSKPAPKKRWLVKDWIPMKAVTLLTGDGGVGKSHLALYLALACASSSDWLGLKTRKGSSIFLSAEDDVDELHRRTKTATIEYDGFDAETDVHFVDLSQIGAVAFPQSGKLSDFGKRLEQTAISKSAKLLVFDTAPNFFDGDENSRADVTAFMTTLSKLARAIDCAIVLLVHPNKQNQYNSRTNYSGSTAWNGSARSRISLTANSSGQIAMRLEKNNSAKTGQTVYLQWVDGRLVKAVKGLPADRLGPAKEKFLEILAYEQARGKLYSAKESNAFAPKQFERHDLNDGFKSRALAEAMSCLLDEGLIEIKVMKSDGKARDRLWLSE